MNIISSENRNRRPWRVTLFPSENNYFILFSENKYVHSRFTTKAKIPMIFWLQLTGINNQKCFAIELMKGFGLDISIFFHAINTYNSFTTLYHLKEIISH